MDGKVHCSGTSSLFREHKRIQYIELMADMFLR